MKKFFSICLLFVVLLGCTKKVEISEEKIPHEKPETTGFEMYKMSEMALLMEQMYAYNNHLRDRIIAKENIGEYPEHFDKIHTAVLTDASDRDLFFDTQAAAFLKTQKDIFENKNTVESFNKMVNSCIACHQKKCGGPIERIKKLYIK